MWLRNLGLVGHKRFRLETRKSNNFDSNPVRNALSKKRTSKENHENLNQWFLTKVRFS